MTDRDSIFAQPLARIADFAFDEKVARVFPDMIRRSVPGYTTIVAMTGLLAQRYATPGSRLYDLGCSLGASTLAMRQNLRADDCRLSGGTFRAAPTGRSLARGHAVAPLARAPLPIKMGAGSTARFGGVAPPGA